MKKLQFFITEQDINTYAQISGDVNPVHLDDKYAKTHGFSGKIAHGMLTMAKIWSVLSSSNLVHPNDFPSAYELSFSAPVYPDDLITLKITFQKDKLLFNATCEDKVLAKGFIKMNR